MFLHRKFSKLSLLFLSGHKKPWNVAKNDHKHWSRKMGETKILNNGKHCYISLRISLSLSLTHTHTHTFIPSPKRRWMPSLRSFFVKTFFHIFWVTSFELLICEVAICQFQLFLPPLRCITYILLSEIFFSSFGSLSKARSSVTSQMCQTLSWTRLKDDSFSDTFWVWLSKQLLHTKDNI
jgi:hypothetical protein